MDHYNPYAEPLDAAAVLQFAAQNPGYFDPVMNAAYLLGMAPGPANHPVAAAPAVHPLQVAMDLAAMAPAQRALHLAAQRPEVQEYFKADDDEKFFDVHLPAKKSTVVTRSGAVVSSVVRQMQSTTTMSWANFTVKFGDALGLSMEDIFEGHLGWRFAGDAKKDVFGLRTEDDYTELMRRMKDGIRRASERKNGKCPTLVLVNLEIPDKPVKGLQARDGRKRKIDALADDDDKELQEHGDAPWTYLKALRAKLACQRDGGFCRVNADGTHSPQSNLKLSGWAKGISVGTATLNTPPNSRAFDRRRRAVKRIRLAEVTNIKREPVDLTHSSDADVESLATPCPRPKSKAVVPRAPLVSRSVDFSFSD